MKHTWVGWLKAQNTSDARTMLAIGGEQPRYTRSRLTTQYRRGEIDEESFEHRTIILRELEAAFAYREVVDVRDPGDWVPINDYGGRARQTHFNSDGDRSYND